MTAHMWGAKKQKKKRAWIVWCKIFNCLDKFVKILSIWNNMKLK